MCIVMLFYIELYVITLIVDKWQLEQEVWCYLFNCQVINKIIHVCWLIHGTLNVPTVESRGFMLMFGATKYYRHLLWRKQASVRDLCSFCVGHLAQAMEPAFKSISSKTSLDKTYFLFASGWQSLSALGFHFLSLRVVCFPVWHL